MKIILEFASLEEMLEFDQKKDIFITLLKQTPSQTSTPSIHPSIQSSPTLSEFFAEQQTKEKQVHESKMRAKDELIKDLLKQNVPSKQIIKTVIEQFGEGTTTTRITQLRHENIEKEKPPIPEGPDWQRQKRLQESTKHRKSVKSLGNIFHPEENPPKTTAEKIKLGLVNDPKKRGRKPKIPPTPEMESMTEEDPEGKHPVKEQFSLQTMRDDTDELLNKYLEQKGKANHSESKNTVTMDS